MTDMDVAYMVAILILMSTENFRECVDYVKRTDMLPEERQFMERVIAKSGMKRKGREFI